MKKKFLMSFLTMSMLLSSVPVFAANTVNTTENPAVTEQSNDGKASYYIGSYGLDIDSISSGEATATASLLRVYGDESKITVYLQEKINGSWTNVGNASTRTTNQSKTYKPTFSTDRGATYRFKAVFEVYENSSIVESRSATSASFTGR